MPVYCYECDCGAITEELRSVSKRNDPLACGECGGNAKLAITPVHFDNLAMGCDSGFPTAYDRWAKLQRAKNTGKQWDSNNRRYGGDWERKR
jgi:putative FmdB family regulatory protein